MTAHPNISGNENLSLAVKINDQFLDDGNIVFQNAGIRQGLESTQMYILYKNIIYIWNWKQIPSVEAPYYKINLKPGVEYSDFKTVWNSVNLFILKEKNYPFHISLASPLVGKFEVMKFSGFEDENSDVCFSS